MSPFARKIEDRYTYKEYLKWESGRCELIDGIVYDMTPAPSRLHQKISIDLATNIYNQLVGKLCEVYVAPFDVRLPDNKEVANENIVTVVQPDIVVVCDSEKLDDLGCLGAPDMVIEILSPSTAAKDLQSKRDLYERHGVKEYWIVHPTDKIIMVYLPGADGGYRKAVVYASEDVLKSTAIADLSVNLEGLFGKDLAT